MEQQTVSLLQTLNDIDNQPLSDTASTLLHDRYSHDGEDNWNDVVSRMVDHIIPEDADNDFRETMTAILDNRVFLPNSPTIVNSGKESGGLFACFVCGANADTLEDHFQVKKEIAMVAKRGGGCGFTGTPIREQGAPVAGSAHGYAYGPNYWAESIARDMDMMTQAGFRQMALMYTLRSDHPDLDSFIDLKQTDDEDFCRQFNQSVMATDDWMEAAINGNGKPGEQLDRIAYNAWNNGEPGLLFYGTANRATPYGDGDCDCDIEATNPCGEQYLPSYGSCNLGSINVANNLFLDNGNYNWSALEEVAANCARFLDHVGSANVFPHWKFQEWYGNHRPIGLGIMGFADLCLQMDIEYGSQESLDLLKNIMETIYEATHKESEQLGAEKGVPNHCGHLDRRNITLLSIAPTGSIAILADCSHGIEPIFSPIFKREDENGNTYQFSHDYADADHFKSAINKDSDKVVTTQEHLDVQASAQRIVDNSVSKTINLPPGATVEAVKQAMIYAYKSGCKGITVYKAGSREKEVLTDGATEDVDPGCLDGSCDI